jgi:RNA polymerase sigma-70 factor (ECF subfamily)
LAVVSRELHGTHREPKLTFKCWICSVPGALRAPSADLIQKFFSMKPLYRDEAPKAPTLRGESLEELPPRDAEEHPIPKGYSDSSFEAIYEKWFDEVTKWIRAMGGPQADREDLVQDVFVVVHRRLHSFDGDNLAGWLYQISRHKVRDFRRLQWAKRVVFGGAIDAGASPNDGVSPLVLLETQEKRNLLMRLLDELNESERAAIVLFELEGYSGKQIAELQAVPLNTVWAHIHQARKKLSQRLAKIEQGGKRKAAQ